MNKKSTAIFLAFLVAAAEAYTFKHKSNPLLPEFLDKSISHFKSFISALPYQLLKLTLTGRLKWDGSGLSANVNDYVDSTIGMLVTFVETRGLDPMPLPNLEDGFEVKPLLLTYSAWAKLNEGYMTGLRNVQRSGDQTVQIFAKTFRVRLKLQFTDLHIIYRYLVQVMRIGPTGSIVGTLEGFVVNVDLLFDFINDDIQLQEFSLTDVGKLTVHLTGNIMTDWLVNPFIGVFVRMFNKVIINAVETTLRNAVQDAIGRINSNVRTIARVVDSIS